MRIASSDEPKVGDLRSSNVAQRLLRRLISETRPGFAVEHLDHVRFPARARAKDARFDRRAGGQWERWRRTLARDKESDRANG